MRLLIAVLAVLVLATSANAAEIPVTTRADGFTDDGRCGLREAMEAANTDTPVSACPAGDAATDVIRLDGGLYLLTVAGTDEDGGATGDLDIRAGSPVAIAGPGVITTLGIDRVLDVAANASLRLDDVTVALGAAPSAPDRTVGDVPGLPGDNGGGIRNAGTLVLADSMVSDNRAGRGGRSLTGPNGPPGGPGGHGGGIYSTGVLTLVRTVIADNLAGTGGQGSTGSAIKVGDGGPGGSGGGVYATGGLTILESRIVDNEAGSGGATNIGCDRFSGGAGGQGGGIFANTVTLTASTVARNRAGAGGAGNEGASGCDGGMSGGAGGRGGGAFVAGVSSVANTLFADNEAGRGGDGGPGGVDGDGGDGGRGGDAGSLAAPNATIFHSSLIHGSAGDGGTRGLAGPGGSTDGAFGEPGRGNALSGAAGTHVARTIIDGDCIGVVTDGGSNLTSAGAGCPGRIAALHLDPDGMPLPGSPAIDGAPAMGCPATDVLGTSRPQGAGCDIGAFEVVAAAATGIPAGVAFPARAIGVGATRVISVHNPGPPGIVISPVVTGADFSATDTCPPVLAGGGTCAVTVRFVPSRAGSRTAWLALAGRRVALAGTGIAPATPPRAQCVVPRLKGKTLRKARRALRTAHCTLGSVTRRGRGRPGRVRKSTPMAGTVLAAGATVDVVVNRRR